MKKSKEIIWSKVKKIQRNKVDFPAKPVSGILNNCTTLNTYPPAQIIVVNHRGPLIALPVIELYNC